MTLSTLNSRVSYPGTGSTGPFAFPFLINVETDLLVTRRSSLGVETVHVWPADFTVTGVKNASGTITLTTALVVGDTIFIRRKPPLTQAMSVRNQGAYFPATLEDEDDRLVMQLQSLQDSLDRCVKLKETIAGGASLTELEPTNGYAVVGTGIGFTMSPISSGAVALPGQGRTTTTLSTYLAKNAVFNVLDYGALPDNATDNTAAFTNCLNACRTAKGNYLIPAGALPYYLPTFTFSTVNQMNVHSNGATIRGAYTGNYPHMLRIDSDSPELFFTGALLLDGACNVGYTAAFMVAASYQKLQNIYFTRCSLCYKFDRDSLATGERGVSETTVTGGHSWACLRIVEALGANTIVNFNGFIASTGVLTDAPTSDLPGGIRPAAWDAADSTTIRAIGASLFFTGTHLTNVRGTALIDCRPLGTTLPSYQSGYGRVYVSQSNVEASYLGGTSNPAAVAAPNDPAPSIVLENCQGSVGGNSDWCTLDATFKGAVKFKNCGFYVPADGARTAYLVNSASASAHIYSEEGSFGRGFTGGHGNSLNAILGGIVHFLGKIILNYRVSAQSIAAGMTVVNFTTPDGSNVTDRFHAAYAAGVFTVPPGGLTDVIVDAKIAFAGAAASADLAVYKNGALYQYAPNAPGIVKAIHVLFPSLAAGDTIDVRAGTNGGAVNLDGSSLNRLIIMASNP